LTLLVPGLLVAIAPALATIAWQMTTRRRDAVRRRKEQLTRVFLDLKSEADVIALQGVFTNAHAGAVAATKNGPSLLLGFLQPFDLTGMARGYTEHLSRFSRLGNELVSITEKESTHERVKNASEATLRLLECYMAPHDQRSALSKLISARPPLDKGQAEARLAAVARAFRDLAEALAVEKRGWWRRIEWP
jgi:hypothetical protein